MSVDGWCAVRARATRSARHRWERVALKRGQMEAANRRLLRRGGVSFDTRTADTRDQPEECCLAIGVWRRASVCVCRLLS